ncbi:hypothetical protein L208DRAFT_1400487 [Tricholoma matsutake]|nr:hypothetical protein L208DRAFT_1405787 [Tricholoma matsutake 945]KAF8230510.1 hypothetical protein L208DRAFT_1400487 [Tricholoma matsutake 945]
MRTLPRAIFSLLLFVRVGRLIIAVHTRHSSILGKAMYKGILVVVAFTGFFLAKLLWTIYSNIKPCISPGDYVLASICRGIFHSLGSMHLESLSYYTRK